MVVEVDVVDATSVMASKRNVADQSYCVYRRASWRLLLSTRYRCFALSALHVPLNPSGDSGSSQERSKKVTGVG
jgi:hypothetical protein